mmetsp:Transcript_107109/g.196671  ORF Transcript_107109/g.196671 Transcript_107109/m.196671 type:complete len:99 (-) Transcript_107109:128-424(-)
MNARNIKFTTTPARMIQRRNAKDPSSLSLLGKYCNIMNTSIRINNNPRPPTNGSKKDDVARVQRHRSWIFSNEHPKIRATGKVGKTFSRTKTEKDMTG